MGKASWTCSTFRVLLLKSNYTGVWKVTKTAGSHSYVSGFEEAQIWIQFLKRIGCNSDPEG